MPEAMSVAPKVVGVINGIVNSIRSCIGAVKNAVDNVAGDMVLSPGFAMADGASGISGGAGYFESFGDSGACQHRDVYGWV